MAFRRTWIIGDVHGCADALASLVAQLPREDHLVLCGDVVNRGPRIAAAMDLAWRLVESGRATWLMGNHEDALLRGLTDGSGGPARRRLEASRTHRELGEEGCRAWAPRLASLPLWRRGDGWLATHAGLDDAGRPDLTVRSPFWARYDGRHGTVIVGHTPVPSVRRIGAIVLVDTGACYGGRLSAFCPETGEVRSVPGPPNRDGLAQEGRPSLGESRLALPC